MANQERGEARVDVGGTAYTLRPTFDALCELESLLDKDIAQILASIDGGRLSGVRAVVWALLQDQHANEIRTLKDASAWIERAGGMDVVFPVLQTVMGINAEPVAGAGAPAENPPTAQDDGTGTTSVSPRPASV